MPHKTETGSLWNEIMEGIIEEASQPTIEQLERIIELRVGTGENIQEILG